MGLSSRCANLPVSDSALAMPFSATYGPRMLRKNARWGTLALVGVAIGCSSSQGATSSSGGPGGSAKPPGLTCLQILQCVVDCPESDSACPDACAEKGTPDGKANVLALATCIDREKCADATCINGKCGEALDACITSSAPTSGGAPLEGDAPPGSVPSDMVGAWGGARDGITERLVFGADGSGGWTSSVVSSGAGGGCLSFTRLVRAGTAVITDKLITIHATSVIQQVQECRPPTQDTKQPAVTEQIEWSRNQNDLNEILIVDAKCAAKYPNQEGCNTVGCPIGLYCTSRLKRE